MIQTARAAQATGLREVSIRNTIFRLQIDAPFARRLDHAHPASLARACHLHLARCATLFLCMAGAADAQSR